MDRWPARNLPRARNRPEVAGGGGLGYEKRAMPARTPSARKSAAPKPAKNKSLETWIWDAACSIRGAKDAPNHKSYNISPSRYIHTSDAETYRPIAEIVEELKDIEAEARETDKALKAILEGALGNHV